MLSKTTSRHLPRQAGQDKSPESRITLNAWGMCLAGGNHQTVIAVLESDLAGPWCHWGVCMHVPHDRAIPLGLLLLSEILMHLHQVTHTNIHRGRLGRVEGV